MVPARARLLHTHPIAGTLLSAPPIPGPGLNTALLELQKWLSWLNVCPGNFQDITSCPHSADEAVRSH